MNLIPIDRDGSPRSPALTLPPLADEVLQATAAMYASLGFHEPWICYLALVDGQIVGTCGFKGPPTQNQVEIAYFTFPTFEGQGHATAMAAALITMARRQNPQPAITAQTLPTPGASHRILQKLGFHPTQTTHHPTDGPILLWHLPS
jgi:RimJ/RimL family protein N-acetyltransferase